MCKSMVAVVALRWRECQQRRRCEGPGEGGCKRGAPLAEALEVMETMAMALDGVTGGGRHGEDGRKESGGKAKGGRGGGDGAGREEHVDNSIKEHQTNMTPTATQRASDHQPRRNEPSSQDE